MDKPNSALPLAATLREFVQLESAGGILLLATAILAMILANSPLAPYYDSLLDTTVAVQIGALAIDKPLLLWINDGLMAVFFFLVGLEIKREFMEGELSSPAQIVLPAVGALGGMAVPAAIYAWLNWGNPSALDGWAIPVATDIAFALALLGVFGSRVPIPLKVFLLTLAIFDDLAAIVIIALFYSGDLSTWALVAGAVALVIAVAMNRLGVTRTSAYILLGVVLWVALLLRLVALPPQVNWGQLLGAAFACGIGFTMSLFIAGLDFEHGGGDYFAGVRLGILFGSVLSALAALTVLHLSLPRRARGVATPGEAF